MLTYLGYDCFQPQVTEFLDIFTSYWAEELPPGEAENPNNRLTKKPLHRTSCQLCIWPSCHPANLSSRIMADLRSISRTGGPSSQSVLGTGMCSLCRCSVKGITHMSRCERGCGCGAQELGLQASPGDGNPSGPGSQGVQLQPVQHGANILQATDVLEFVDRAQHGTGCSCDKVVNLFLPLQAQNLPVDASTATKTLNLAPYSRPSSGQGRWRKQNKKG